MSARYNDSVKQSGVKLWQSIKILSGKIAQIAWSPDGAVLASLLDDGTINLWKTEDWKALWTVKASPKERLCLAWSASSRVLASGCDERIEFWDKKTGQLINSFNIDLRLVTSLNWSPNEKTLVSAHDDGVLRLWSLADGKLLNLVKGHTGEISKVIWSADGNTLVSISMDKTVRFWNPLSGQLRKKISVESERSCIALSPNGRILATSSQAQTIQLLNLKGRRKRRILEGHTARVTGLSFSLDGKILASLSQDNTIRLWDSNSSAMLASIKTKQSKAEKIEGLAFHPTAPLLAAIGGADNVIHVWELDTDVLWEHQRAVETVQYATAKIALLGNNGVGKTSLGWRLAYDEFKEHPSTHGQQFWSLVNLGLTRRDGTRCEAALWDCAGQADYRLTHSLFLNDVDLALVLFNTSRPRESLNEIEYWLNHISNDREHPYRIILVGTQKDRGTIELTPEEFEWLCRRHENICGYVLTSALTGEGMSELVSLIRDETLWDNMPAIRTTATFEKIKKEVLKLKEDTTRKEVLKSFPDLRRQLQEIEPGWRFSDNEMMVAISHLETRGFVYILQRSSRTPAVLLAPDLLINLIASFTLEASKEGVGALDESRLLRGEYQFPELSGLPVSEQKALLDEATTVLLERNICYRETFLKKALIIFPSLITRPDLQLELVETRDDCSYILKGAVEKVYSTLVVLLAYTNVLKLFHHGPHHALYEMNPGEICGLRLVGRGPGIIELVLSYKDGVPDHALSLFRSLFETFLFEKFIKKQPLEVVKYSSVDCPDCGKTQEREAVIKQSSMNKSEIYCFHCGRQIPLSNVVPISPIEGFTVRQRDRQQVGFEDAQANLRTEFEKVLVEVKRYVHERDKQKAAPSCYIVYAWGASEHEDWVLTLAKDLRNAGINVSYDKWHNEPGKSISGFIERLDTRDYVAVICTPRLMEKYTSTEIDSVVRAELKFINTMSWAKEKRREQVLPLLVEGLTETAIPMLFRDSVFIDFREKKNYFDGLLTLLLKLYNISFEYPSVADWHERLEQSRGKRPARG